jgi:hypothetical protein
MVMRNLIFIVAYDYSVGTEEQHYFLRGLLRLKAVSNDLETENFPI